MVYLCAEKKLIFLLMKVLSTKFLLLLSVIVSISFTSCEEGATIDVPGPDIEYQFTYSDSILNTFLKSETIGYKLVAQTDTIQGRNIESFLSSKGQDYTSVVEAATLSNTMLTLTGDASFSGVDSIQIRYTVSGSDNEILLASAGIDSINGQTVTFSDIQIDKAKTFELIKSNIVAKIYAIYDLPKTNCFKNGIMYKFTAKTTLSVKLAALTQGLSSSTL